MSLAGVSVAAALGESTGTCGEGGRDLSVSLNPVGERILAVLDDGLGRLVSIIRGAGLTRCDWSIINELQEMLSVTSDDGELLAVFAKSIELVGKRSLQLLAGDV